jgi:nitrous oxide reductase accessory protein NosL
MRSDFAVAGVAAALVAVLLVAACDRSPRTCSVCRREECTGFTYRMTLDDGKKVEACCARCGLTYLERHHVHPRRVEATDFASGRWIDGTRAIYVSGSDMSHCPVREGRRDTFGCCALKGYDRCLPSLLAFESRGAAETFRARHGGDLVTCAQLRFGRRHSQ